MTITNIPMTTEEIAAIDLLIELELGASQSDRIEGWERLESLVRKLPPPPAEPDPSVTPTELPQSCGGRQEREPNG